MGPFLCVWLVTQVQYRLMVEKKQEFVLSISEYTEEQQARLDISKAAGVEQKMTEMTGQQLARFLAGPQPCLVLVLIKNKTIRTNKPGFFSI